MSKRGGTIQVNAPKVPQVPPYFPPLYAHAVVAPSATQPAARAKAPSAARPAARAPTIVPPFLGPATRQQRSKAPEHVQKHATGDGAKKPRTVAQKVVANAASAGPTKPCAASAIKKAGASPVADWEEKTIPPPVRCLNDLMAHILPAPANPPSNNSERISKIFDEMLDFDDEKMEKEASARPPKPLKHLDDLLVHLAPENRPPTFMASAPGQFAKNLDQLFNLLGPEEGSPRPGPRGAPKALETIDDLAAHLPVGAPLCVKASSKDARRHTPKALKNIDDLAAHLPAGAALCVKALPAPTKQNSNLSLPWFSSWWVVSKPVEAEEKKSPAPPASDGKSGSSPKVASLEDDDLVIVGHDSMTRSKISVSS